VKIVELENIAAFINGYPFKPTDWGPSGLKIIRIQNLTNTDKAFNRTTKTVPDKYLIKKGDILVSWSATLDVFEWEDEENALLNQHIFKVEPDFNVIDKRYFKYALRYSIQKMSQFTHGSTMKHIVRKDFLKHHIPLPSLEEQKRIIKVLNEASSLCQKRKQSISHLDEYLKSVFLDMFGDPTKNPNKYSIKIIKDIAIKVTDGEHITPIRTKSGVKLLSARNIKNGYIDLNTDVDYIGLEEYKRIYKRCNPEFGDLLISCSGTIGRVTTVNIVEPFTLVRSVALIKPDKDKIRVKYLEYYLQTSYSQRMMNMSVNKSSQANLFLGQINKLPVLLPSIKDQDKFIHYVQKQRDIRQKMLLQYKELEKQFQALMQKAFN